MEEALKKKNKKKNNKMNSTEGELVVDVMRLGELTDLEPIMETCRKVGRVFGESLYMGLDILIDRDGSRHYVAEVNAFGDLLPELLHRGEDTYTAELRALREKRRGTCPL